MIKTGQTEQKLGQTQREFTTAAENSFIQPLRRFLEGEMKTITREKGILESKRLDLDACKNRVRKARSMLGQQTVTAPHIQLNCLISYRKKIASLKVSIDIGVPANIDSR